MDQINALIKYWKKSGITLNKSLPIGARVGRAFELLIRISNESGRPLPPEECLLAAHMVAGYGAASFMIEKEGFDRADIFSNGEVIACRTFSGYRSKPVKIKRKECLKTTKEWIKNDTEMHANCGLRLDIYAKNSRFEKRKFATVYAKHPAPYPLLCYQGVAASASNTELISYIWMAIESGASIAFIGNECAAAKSIFSLLSLLPGNGKIIMLSGNRIWLEEYRGITLLKPAKSKILEQTSSILASRAMLVVSDSPEDSSIQAAFQAGASGIPFMINLGSIKANDTIKVLFSNPYRIARDHLSALDLVIELDDNGRILNIWELKWAEKSIISPPTYGYRMVNMISNGRINRQLLESSEIGSLYIRINPSSISSFKKELDFRSKYLISEGCKAEQAGHSATYFMSRIFGFPRKRIKYAKSRMASADGLSGVTARTEGCGPSRPGPTPG